MTFTDLVKEHFLFLENEYSFIFKIEDESTVTFERSDLNILMSWHKGEVDIDFYVQRETPILRPNRSRMFRLTNVAKFKDKKALDDAPKFPNYITTMEDAGRQLKFSSQLMKRYCTDILNGEITPFENIMKQT